MARAGEWDVDIELAVQADQVVEFWMGMEQRLNHEKLVQVRGYGFSGEEDEDATATAQLRIRADDAEAAESAAIETIHAGLRGHGLAAVADSPEQHPLTATAEPAQDFDDYLKPKGAEDFESRLEPAPWHRAVPSADERSVKIVWGAGVSPLERVDVEEDEEAVTISLWERYPPNFDADGTPIAIALPLYIRCVEVNLPSPLRGRRLLDGATGEEPERIKPGEAGQRSLRRYSLDVDIDDYPCQPTPSGEKVDWQSKPE